MAFPEWNLLIKQKKYLLGDKEVVCLLQDNSADLAAIYCLIEITATTLYDKRRSIHLFVICTCNYIESYNIIKMTENT